MKILVINSGSSSLKYQLFDMTSGDVLAKGLCERIGGECGIITHKRPGHDPYKAEPVLPDHGTALSLVLELITDKELHRIPFLQNIALLGAGTVDLDLFCADVFVHQRHGQPLDCLGQKLIKSLPRIVLFNRNRAHSTLQSEK